MSYTGTRMGCLQDHHFYVLFLIRITIWASTLSNKVLNMPSHYENNSHFKTGKHTNYRMRYYPNFLPLGSEGLVNNASLQKSSLCIYVKKYLHVCSCAMFKVQF